MKYGPILDQYYENGKIETARASPSGKASAFQADIHGFESHRPLFLFKNLPERL